VDGKPLIVALESNHSNLELIRQFLEKEGFQVLGLTSMDELDTILEEGEAFDLALLDLTGYNRSIWDRCERLRKGGTPFLIISPRQSADIQKESLTHGAKAILVKPLAVSELVGLIRSLLGE